MSTTTLLVGAAVFTPTAVEGVDVSRAGGVLVHEVLGREDPDATIRPAGSRVGTVEFTFADEAIGKTAMDALAVTGVGQVTSTSAALTMTFVVPAGQSMNLSRARVGYWTLSVPFREVQP